jgi:hypothetical protein
MAAPLEKSSEGWDVRGFILYLVCHIDEGEGELMYAVGMDNTILIPPSNNIGFVLCHLYQPRILKPVLSLQFGGLHFGFKYRRHQLQVCCAKNTDWY